MDQIYEYHVFIFYMCSGCRARTIDTFIYTHKHNTENNLFHVLDGVGNLLPSPFHFEFAASRG